MAGDTSSQDASTRFHHSMVPSPAASVRFHGSAPRSPPMRVLRAPNPFPERSNPLRSLRDAPPLPSRYDEEDQRDLNVIRNDLDEAQSRMLSTQQSSRPVARPLVHSSRRDYGFQPRDAAETARRATQQPLDTYMSGPAAATAEEQVLWYTLRKRYLTSQVTTP
ncbi:Zinc (Zn2)-Iron (Fe2) Permease (ZIP) Family [Phytophthora nicotianae]|nr:Zinc (Zn2)-Iron (Fe2) Permease (ZIP) Family [Phytophthora nicotianae]